MTTAAAPLSMLLIHPLPATSAAPPVTLSGTMAWLSAVSPLPVIGQAIPDHAPDHAERLLNAMAQAAVNHHTIHCVCRSELTPASLRHLMLALQARPSRLRLSLSCRIHGRQQVDLPAPNTGGAIVQIQWRTGEKLPDFGFFRAISRAGIWNHLVLEGRVATAATGNAIARQPNIIHSWGAVNREDGTDAADDGYRRMTPLPGRPLWQAIDDPVHRFMLIARFGNAWLLRSRVDDDGDGLLAVGEALAYRFCPPDRLPEGYLDEICAMVAAGGTVAGTHVRSNLERAFLIGYVLENGVLVGNSSLKHPRPAYIDAVRRQSGLDLAGFVERGYTSVRPEYRGLGIGTKLLSGLTARAGDRKIFSVIAEDNHATKVIARRNRTRQVATYFSEKAGKRVGIWMPVWMIDDHEKKQS